MSDPSWTPLKLIAWTQGYFARSGVDAPRLTAEILLAHALGCDRVRLYLEFDKPLGDAELARYRELVKRRAAGEPTAYLTGTKEFYGRPFRVDPRVLIPRPETELVAEAAAEALPEGGTAIDVCTGSGCIGVTLALERPGARILATDRSTAVLDVARDNARRLGAQLELLAADLLEAVRPAASFDLIVSNPPYVPSGELPGLAREVQREPSAALDGGPDGLCLIRRLVAEAPARLRPGGALIVEIHETLAEAVPAACRAVGFAAAELHRDLAGLPRFVIARTAGAPSPAK